jgi:hypothetical protein
MISSFLRSALVLSPILCTGCIIHISGKDVDWDDDGHRSVRWSYSAGRRTTTQTRTIEVFDRVRLEGPMDVEVRVGTPASVWMRGRSALLDHVVTRMDEGTLIIAIDEQGQRDGGDYDEIEIQVGVESLLGVALVGSGDVLVEGVQGDRFAVHLSGSGEILARGAVQEVEADLSGSGEIDLRQLGSRSARVSVSGSGDVRVHPRETLDASVSGSGDVHYLGAPEVHSQVSGSGRVRSE